MSISPQELCQIEIQVDDLDRSVQFYQNVFGWSPVPAEIHEVTVLDVPQECPYGISLVPGRHSKAADKGRIVLYFESKDPKALVDRALENGGTLRFGPKKLRGYGEIYQIVDPNGIRFGLFRKS